jgi:hypothetical protein
MCQKLPGKSSLVRASRKKSMLKKIAPFMILLASAAIAVAQTATAQTATAQQSPDPQQQQEEKAKLEKKAVALLEQVVTDSQGLRLPENKIRVNIAAGDMLWDKNPARGRSLLTDAGAMLGQVMMEVDRNDREDVMMMNQLRQELVLTAGRHDAELGYQLLHSTQQQPQTQTAINAPGRGNRGLVFDQGNNLEQALLATVATTDPKFAYQKAVESLDKGDFPTSLSRILTQLQTKDAELFKKLSDKTLNRLASDSLLASREATSVAMNLLSPGPMPASTASTQPTSTAASNTNVRAPILSESAYHDLMDSAITAALSVTSMGPVNNTQRGGGAARVMRGPQQQQQQQQNPPDDATVRQNNARSLLFSLQGMLPQIDQYMPERAQSVRQKLTELGVNTNTMQTFGNQMRTMQQGSSDSLVTAASTAPPQIQSRIYQQAAQRAIDEGNTDKALDIATNHLDEAGKTAIMQAVDFKKLTMTASPEKMNEIKQKLAALPSDTDRVKYLIDLATATQKDNQKLALRFMDDARTLIARRAMNYNDFQDQLKVADAYATLDAKKSFEIMDAGIAQLNELLSAATILNGFEVDIFKEGELSLKANDDLVGMVARYGAQLSALAKVDFDGARSSAEKFQMPEPRMNARLMIVQSILGTQPVANVNNRRGLNNFQFVMR